MRHLKLAVFCTAGLLLAGCQPTREQLAMQASQDDATCKSYGARPGTESMVNCRVALANQRNAQDMQRRRSMVLMGAAMMANPAPAPVVAGPRTCSSVPNGVGGANITCF